MQSLRKLLPVPGLQLQEVDVPAAPGAGEVLLRVRAAGICGTDLHIDEWTPSYHFLTDKLPVTAGHEFSAEVAAVGPEVHGLQPGQLVAVRPSVVCGICAACRAGHHDACSTRTGIGVSRDGAFAAFTRAPARNCIPVPAGVDADLAAMAEPLTVSHESVRVGGVQPGDRVLVLGPGNIGQGIAVFARAAGAREVVIAGHGDGPRFDVLRRMGFDRLVDFAETGTQAGWAGLAKDGPFDVVIEATGAGAVVEPALAALKLHGVLVITGIHAKPVAIDLTALVRRHQQIRGSYRAPESDWPRVLQFMQQHADVLRHMVTHKLPLARAQEGFALARNKVATKVLLQPQEASA